MDQKEVDSLFMQIGLAFRALPDDATRLNVLATLTGTMIKRIPEGMARDWVDTAQAYLSQSIRFLPQRKDNE